MTLGSLRKTFLDNAVVKTIFDHSEKIAVAGFMAGHTTLIASNGLEPGFAAAAGGCFILADTSLFMAKKFPVGAFRLCGAFALAGTACLSAGGFNFDTMQVDNWLRVVSPLVAIPSISIISMQNEIAQFSKKLEKAKSSLVRTFAAVASRFPLALTSPFALIGGLGLFASAVIDQNVPMMATMGFWAFGGIGLLMSDPQLQVHYKEERTKFLEKIAAKARLLKPESAVEEKAEKEAPATVTPKVEI